MACLIASAAVVAFVALRHGEFSALRVTGGCLLLLVFVSLFLYGTAAHIPLIATSVLVACNRGGRCARTQRPGLNTP